MSSSQAYKLSAELDPPHGSDVKAVLPLPGGRVATASRDQSVGIWKRDAEGKSLELHALLGGHGAYVNSLAYIPSSETDPTEYIASGGNSSLILLHSLSTLDAEPVHTLIGHQLNVSTLHYSSKRQKLISGSWDRTARIWSRSHVHQSSSPPLSSLSADYKSRGRDDQSGWRCTAVLEEHEEAVWGVLAIDQGPEQGGWLTASADRLIYLWNGGGELLKRFKGSPEPARGITALPGDQGFASACNDGVVRKWDWSGSVTALLRGHTDYVYQVATGPGDKGKLLSCGEDHTARIWADDGTCETMLHPCQTVWAVGQLEDGDIVTAGSDGRVRLWSSDESRQASSDVQEVYEARVAEAMKNYKSSLGEDQAGGQTEPVTIDIDISDDAPPIPLVFRPGDDAREVAVEFGRTHKLSDNYINQIEQFILVHIN